MGPNIFFTQNFLIQIFFNPKFCGHKIFFDQHFFGYNIFLDPRIFWTNISFWNKDSFGYKFILRPKFSFGSTNKFLDHRFFGQKIVNKIFVGPYIFRTQFFRLKTLLDKIFKDTFYWIQMALENGV